MVLEFYSVTTRQQVLIIFHRNLYYERKIFPSVDWFFLRNLPTSEWTYSCFFLKILKCSYGFVECAFDNSDENFSLKIRWKCETNYKHIVFLKKKYFSPKCFSGHVECSFNNPVKDFSAKSEKFSPTVEKIYKVKIFFHFFLLKRSYGQVQCTYEKPAKNFSSKFEYFSLDARKNSWIYCFFQNIFFCGKTFLRTCRMQFWQLCLKLLAQSPNNIRKFLCFKKRLEMFM